MLKLGNGHTPANCQEAVAELQNAELQIFVLGLLQHQEDLLTTYMYSPSVRVHNQKPERPVLEWAGMA